MELLEKTIEAISPAWAASRAKARFDAKRYRRAANSFDTQSKYDAAKRGRRLENWSPTGTSINAENEGALSILRRRSRHLIQNTGMGKRAKQVLKNNIVRGGIRPNVLTENDDFEDAIRRWARSPRCDKDGVTSLYGIQSLVVGTRMESGSALVIRHRLPFERGRIPLALEVREPDWIDTDYTTKLANDNVVIQGVEFNSRGQRVAYHMYREHPGSLNVTFGNYDRRRIPAEDVAYVFDRWRPGQVHGVPDLAPVMVKMRDLGELDDAQLVKQKVAACFTAFVESSNRSTMPGEEQTNGDFHTRVEPGMIQYLDPGEEITFGQPPQVEGYRDFATIQKMEVAAGLGIPYEIFAGDYSQVSFISGRMGSLEFDRRIDHDHATIYEPQLLFRIGEWLAEAGELMGMTDGSDIIGWTAPKREMIDPQKETEASIRAIRGGLSSRPAEIRKRGRDPEEVDTEIASDNDKIDEEDFIFDSDARRQNANGTPRRGNEEVANAG